MSKQVEGWQVLYFDAPTRGEQLRMLFAAANTPFKDVRFSFPKGLTPYKQETLGDKSPLMFDQCPTVISPEGTAVSQVSVRHSMKYAPQVQFCILEHKNTTLHCLGSSGDAVCW